MLFNYHIVIFYDCNLSFVTVNSVLREIKFKSATQQFVT